MGLEQGVLHLCFRLNQPNDQNNSIQIHNNRWTLHTKTFLNCLRWIRCIFAMVAHTILQKWIPSYPVLMMNDNRTTTTIAPTTNIKLIVMFSVQDLFFAVWILLCSALNFSFSTIKKEKKFNFIFFFSSWKWCTHQCSGGELMWNR